MKKLQFHSLEFKQFLKKFELVYSPRTTLAKQREQDQQITNQIIKHFDPFTVNFLKSEFDLYNGKVNKIEFISCLKSHLLQWNPQDPNRKESLAKYLSLIFDGMLFIQQTYTEIDLLDKQEISWEDFSNYLISKACTGNGGQGKQPFKKNSMALGASDGQNMGQAVKIKPYSLTTTAQIPFKDREKHKQPKPVEKQDDLDGKGDANNKKGFENKDEVKGAALHKAIYLGDLDKVAIVEERSDTIQFINPRNGERACKDLDCGVNASKLNGQTKSAGFSQFKKKINVMCMTYLRLEDFNNLLLVATDDSLIRSWYYNGNQFIPVNPIINDEPHEGDIKILKGKQPQYCMAWDDIHQMLYTGQRDGMINVWSLRQSKPVGFLGINTDIQAPTANQNNAFLRQSTLIPDGGSPSAGTESGYANFVSTASTSGIGHKDIVTELLMLPKLQYLASCSLDKKVILWDTITGEQKRVYQEHTMGVVSMTFNTEHILLFSAGFDHDICVWNPYIDNPVYKVQAHNAPIVCVYAIDHTPQLISSDSDGVIKVWDIRSFDCVQTINVQENFESFKFNLSYMLPIWSHKRVMVCGRQIMFFEYDKNQNPSLADDQAPLQCIYLHRSQEFYTPVIDSVKCWNALTGAVKTIFRDLISHSEITAFCMDQNQKRFIIGDSRGQVKVFNYTNGELMKVLGDHPESEILNLMTIQTKEMNMIISAGSNNVIQVHEDDKFYETSVRRTIQIPNYEIQIARVYQYQNLKFLLVGLNKGQIKSYELETGRPDASYPAHSQGDILEIYALENKPFFFTSDTLGNVCLWIGPPSVNKYLKCFEFTNIDQDSQENCAVCCIVYNECDDILYTGDERGCITAYQFGSIIQGVNLVDDLSYHKKQIAFDLESLKVLWMKKDHAESIRHLNFQKIYEQKLLISTSFDRKIKIWNAMTGEIIDSLRKGTNEEAQPIGFVQRVKEEQKSALNPLATRNAKKLVGIDLEALKKKVENNPLIEKIKQQITANEKSSEWNLFVNVDKIKEEETLRIEEIRSQIDERDKKAGQKHSVKQNQMDLEIMNKMYHIYQGKLQAMGDKRSEAMQGSNNKYQMHQPRLQPSVSQPTLKPFGQNNFAVSITSGFAFSEIGRSVMNNAPATLPTSQLKQLSQEATEDDVMMYRRRRFVEQQESLSTQKLLYPSKFRKDPYRNKINMKEAANGASTRLPSIMKSKQGSSGQMLMGMIGVREKRLPRNVSEAALKLISALDRAEEL